MNQQTLIMEFNAETIEKAVYQFYFVPANQIEAHKWLTAAQESTEAWKFCWELMQPEKSQEVQFFGANTLCLKLCNSKVWDELNEEQFQELKVKLIQHVVVYISQGPRIILTRLCVALASFILRTIPSYWTSAISDIINFLQPINLPQIPPDKSSTVLLLILTVLTEEFQSMTVAQTFRSHVRLQLHSNSERVLALVQQTLMKSNDASLSLHALQCLHKWIVFGISIPDCTKMIDLVFNFIVMKDFNEISSDILQSIIFHPDCCKYPESVLKLLEKILQLENNLLIAIQEKDSDTCMTLCGLFTAIGESHTRLFLEAFLKDNSARENFLKLVKIILTCTGAPGQYPIDETFSYITFAFWYNLQDEIISVDKKNATIYRSYFTSIFEFLVDVLLQKLMSPKIKSSWTLDEIEQFRCYREDIGDTLMYCYNLLRSKMLERLLNHLNNVLLSSKLNSDEVDQALEACLGAMQSVADSVGTEENVFVPQFISQLLNIPYQNKPHLLACIIDTIGPFSEWINCNPSALSQIVPFLLLGLSEPGASSSATLALTDISRDCQLKMRPYAESILTICQEVFVKRLLKRHEEVRLMYPIGYVGSLLHPDLLMGYLRKLLQPVYIEMLEISQKVELTADEQTLLLCRLKILSTLFHTLNVKLKDDDDDEEEKKCPAQKKEIQSLIMQPVLPLLVEFFPVLKNIISNWPLCLPLTDTICDLLKRAVTNLLDDVLPALENILLFLNMIYSSLPSVAALTLFKTIALMFFDNQERKLMVQNSLILIVNNTLAVSQMGGLSNHSDICDSFCQLIAQLLKKLPTSLQHDQINLLLLFQYGIAVLAIPEAPAVKAASMLLVNFINQSRDYANMLNIVNNYGHILLSQIFSCVGGSSPRGVMDSLTDILSAMVKKYFDNTTRWLHSITSKENFPSIHVNKEQKEVFVTKILKDYSNKRKLQEHVKTFSLTCRGLIGTEYGTQILPNL